MARRTIKRPAKAEPTIADRIADIDRTLTEVKADIIWLLNQVHADDIDTDRIDALRAKYGIRIADNGE